MTKPTLSDAIDNHLELSGIEGLSCEELGRAVAKALGYTPSLTAVSRIMGKKPDWEKITSGGKIYFARSSAE
jgi:hypothetical protein